MGDPTKFNYIWEYNLFNFALLMLFISEIFIFVYTHGKKDRKVISMIIPGLFEPPVRTLRATIPENESHIFR